MPHAPPPLAMLQLFNALTALGSVLTVMISNAAWTRAAWPSWKIGLAMTIANLCYACVVGLGGRLADRWGRAPTCILGAGIGAAGCLLALIAPGDLTGLVAAMLGFAGPALFFPACAGLFSDAEGAAGTQAPPLHRKVGSYNLGWSLGNLGAFAGSFLLADLPLRTGYACGLASFLAVALLLWRWRRLPALPPPALGDRAAHPALPRLTLMARVALMLGCMLGMSMIALLPFSLERTRPEQARAWAGLTLAAYAFGYVGMFVLLGRWSGWVLRPWRLWLVQFGFLAGAGGLALLGAQPRLAGLVLCGLACGIAYGACYTGSIYYSLRLPHGAGRAAGLHETFIGMGNSIGPLLSGAVLAWGVAASGATELRVLACFLGACGGALLLWQALLIPGAVRLGARAGVAEGVAAGGLATGTAR